MSHGLANLDNTGTADKFGACGGGLTEAQEARTPALARITQLADLVRRVADCNFSCLVIVLSAQSSCLTRANLVARTLF